MTNTLILSKLSQVACLQIDHLKTKNNPEGLHYRIIDNIVPQRINGLIMAVPLIGQIL